MKHKKLYFFNVILPLLLACMIYLFFRSLSLKLFDWLSIIGVADVILEIRYYTLEIKENIPGWFYYSFPDGLWMYAFTSIYIIVWNNSLKTALRWLVFPIILGPFYELLQLFKCFPGTFDIVDLIFYILAFLLSLYLLKPPKLLF